MSFNQICQRNLHKACLHLSLFQSSKKLVLCPKVIQHYLFVIVYCHAPIPICTNKLWVWSVSAPATALQTVKMFYQYLFALLVSVQLFPIFFCSEWLNFLCTCQFGTVLYSNGALTYTVFVIYLGHNFGL